MEAISRHLTRKPLWLYVGLTIFLGIAVWLASMMPDADWTGTFDGAARGLLSGHSPYEQPLYVNPPWGVLILVPFVLFPPTLARGLVLVASVLALTYVGWRLHAPKLAFIALLLSPTAIGALLAANLDSFVTLGTFLPMASGLLVLMIKPQLGTGVAIYYLVEAWRERRLMGVLRTFGPLVVLAVVSLVLFPVWAERLLTKPANIWNRSLFPFGIPIGLALLALAIWRRNRFFALAAGPFLSPYLTFYTYLMVQIGLLHEDVEKYIRRDVLHVLLCVFLWVIMLTFHL